MRRNWLPYAVAMIMAGAASAQTQIDPSHLDKSWVRSRTQVLVVGTVHFRNAPKGSNYQSLDPVLERLAAFKPQIITVEQIAGEGCDFMARHPTTYPPEDLRRYCKDTTTAREATGLDVPTAIAEVDKALKNWPARPAFAQRRHLAALFLAANDDVSANVQWLQLPKTERHAGDGLNNTLVTTLNGQSMRNDESYQIAARLAARLGLQRVFAIDDHTGDSVVVTDEKAFANAIQQAWDAAKAKLDPIHKREDELWRSGDMLRLYRYINDPATLKIAIEGDFGAALYENSPQQYGRLYVAGWETRNLRMVANIHAAFRESPGARVLSIVGSSHKPWFDSLLGQMQGVDIVDTEKVLK
jgi:hypothetical protein